MLVEGLCQERANIHDYWRLKHRTRFRVAKLQNAEIMITKRENKVIKSHTKQQKLSRKRNRK